MSTPMTALLARTVRLSTRGWGTHLTRLLLGVVVFITLISTSIFSARFGAAGLHLLNNLVWWSAVFITLAGIGLFCSAITEEKEEQTIGLLRMAGLRSVAILLAKSTARFYDALMLFAILLPFTMLAVTLGGVSVDQVLACAVALTAYIFFLANLGLLLSVLRPTTQKASGLMVLILIFISFAPILFRDFPFASLLNEMSIWYRLSEILSTGYNGGIFSAQLWMSLSFGICTFIASVLLFDRFVHDEDAKTPERMSVTTKSRLRIFGVSRAPVGISAVVWKDYHFSCGGRTMSLIKPLIMLGLIIGSLLIPALFYSGSRFNDLEAKQIGITVQFIALLWIVFELAIHLSKIFAHEVRGETLAGLLSLPYTISELAYAKVFAALKSLLPAIGVLMLGIFIAPTDFFRSASQTFSSIWGWVFLLTIIFFWHACAYLSLILRRSPLIAAIGLVIGVQFFYYMLAAIFFFSSMGRGGNGEAINSVIIILYIIASIYMHISIAKRLAIKGAQS